jgi:hypothetical protein
MKYRTIIKGKYIIQEINNDVLLARFANFIERDTSNMTKDEALNHLSEKRSILRKIKILLDRLGYIEREDIKSLIIDNEKKENKK